MYIPTENRWTDRRAILAFMRQHSFAAMITGGQAELQATHLPFILEEQGEKLILHAHLARSNPQDNAIAASEEILVIFSGPHAYISPRHYDRADSVPTWNYLAVHAYGRATIVTDEAEAYNSLERLMDASEPGYEAHWAKISEKYTQGLFRGIVPFRIEVTRLDAKAKMSQNKSEAERRRIIDDLSQSDDADARATASFMQSAIDAHLHE